MTRQPNGIKNIVRHLGLRSGVTLIEVIMATALLTVIATTVLYYSRQPGDRVKQHACDLHAERLEVNCQQYRLDYGVFPSSSMTELGSVRYLGESLPVCPVDGRAYIFESSTGKVIRHSHPAP